MITRVPPPVLRRFEVRLLENKTSTDNTQVPASATIEFYRQGATVSQSITVPYVDPESPEPPPPTAVSVYNLGAIEAGDALQVGLSGTSILTVAELDEVDPLAPTVLVFNHSVPAGIGLTSGDRLIDRTNRPQVYSDPTGQSPPLAANTIATDANGWAATYLRAYRFDYIIRGTLPAERVCPDAVGSFEMRGG